MTTKIIENNEHFELYYHVEDKIVHHVFKEKLDSKRFPIVLNRGTEILKENSATKWLSDNRRHIIPLTDEDNAWANNVWLPKTMALGWKYWAIVVPNSMVNQVDLIRYVESFHDKGILVKVFSDDERALAWLQEVD